MQTQAADWFPLPTLPPLVAWTVEADGRYSRFEGPAAAVAPPDVGTLIGQHYEDATREMPEVRAVLEAALSGVTAADLVEAWGCRWFLIARPESGPRGEVVRVHGTGMVLPAGAVVPSVRPAPLVQSWVVEAPVRQQGIHWRPGDVVTLRGGNIYRTSLQPEHAARNAILQHDGERLRPLAAPPASPPPPRRLPAPPARLRLVVE